MGNRYLSEKINFTIVHMHCCIRQRGYQASIILTVGMLWGEGLISISRMTG